MAHLLALFATFWNFFLFFLFIVRNFLRKKYTQNQFCWKRNKISNLFYLSLLFIYKTVVVRKKKIVVICEKQNIYGLMFHTCLLRTDLFSASHLSDFQLRYDNISLVANRKNVINDVQTTRSSVQLKSELAVVGLRRDEALTTNTAKGRVQTKRTSNQAKER